MKPATTILDDCSRAFKGARERVVEAMRLLYQIDQTNAWEGKFSGFSEYVEQECQISRGQASKLLAVWKYYVIDGAVSHAKLKAIDPEKLYLAIRLPTGTPEQRLVKAHEWNREDFRAELSTVEEHNCQDFRVTICTKCHARLS